MTESLGVGLPFTGFTRGSFAVADFKDYPTAPFGNTGDYPWRVDRDFTDNSGTVNCLLGVDTVLPENEPCSQKLTLPVGEQYRMENIWYRPSEHILDHRQSMKRRHFSVSECTFLGEYSNSREGASPT